MSSETVEQFMRRQVWTCMVCRRERPDAAISVVHRPLKGFEDNFPNSRWNVRYCNDDPACAAYALAEGPWRPPERG